MPRVDHETPRYAVVDKFSGAVSVVTARNLHSFVRHILQRKVSVWLAYLLMCPSAQRVTHERLGTKSAEWCRGLRCGRLII